MRDQRADALAQILVRYSTKVKEGDVCVIQSTTTAEPLVQAVYEEVLQRRRPADRRSSRTEGAAPAFYELASDEQLDWVAADRRPGPPRRPTSGSRSWPTRTRARSRSVDPTKQARAQKARKPLMETLDAARSAAGELPLGAHAVPDARLRREAGMSLADYEDFYYRACLATDPDPVDRLAAPVGRGQAARRLDRGQGGGPHRRRPAPTSRSASRAARWIPCVRRAQHARRRVLHRSRRGLGQRRGQLLASRPSTAAARWRA